jgi:hypothetical protein
MVMKFLAFTKLIKSLSRSQKTAIKTFPESLNPVQLKFERKVFLRAVLDYMIWLIFYITNINALYKPKLITEMYGNSETGFYLQLKKTLVDYFVLQ